MQGILTRIARGQQHRKNVAICLSAALDFLPGIGYIRYKATITRTPFIHKAYISGQDGPK
jgi:hypothetical protein